MSSHFCKVGLPRIRLGAHTQNQQAHPNYWILEEEEMVTNRKLLRGFQTISLRCPTYALIFLSIPNVDRGMQLIAGPASSSLVLFRFSRVEELRVKWYIIVF